MLELDHGHLPGLSEEVGDAERPCLDQTERVLAPGHRVRVQLYAGTGGRVDVVGAAGLGQEGTHLRCLELLEADQVDPVVAQRVHRERGAHGAAGHALPVATRGGVTGPEQVERRDREAERGAYVVLRLGLPLDRDGGPDQLLAGAEPSGFPCVPVGEGDVEGVAGAEDEVVDVGSALVCWESSLPPSTKPKVTTSTVTSAAGASITRSSGGLRTAEGYPGSDLGAEPASCTAEASVVTPPVERHGLLWTA